MIGGGEPKIDPVTMEVIVKWLGPTNVTKVRSFVGVAQYLRNIIAYFSLVSMPLHAKKNSIKSFSGKKIIRKVLLR